MDKGHPALAGRRVDGWEPAFCNSGHSPPQRPPRRCARCALCLPHRITSLPFTASPHRRTASTTGRCEPPLLAAPTTPLPSPPSLPATSRSTDALITQLPDPTGDKGSGARRHDPAHHRQSKTRRELSPCRAANRVSPAEGLVPEPGGGSQTSCHAGSRPDPPGIAPSDSAGAVPADRPRRPRIQPS